MPDFNPLDINAMIARIEERQLSNTTKLDYICEKLGKHDDRIKRVEHFNLKLAGGVTVFSCFASWVLTKLSK